MLKQPKEVWRFSVICDPQVEHVQLVMEDEVGVSVWVKMTPHEPGHWSVDHALPAGRYQVRYFSKQQGTIINCGTYGLTAEHVSGEAEVEFDLTTPAIAS